VERLRGKIRINLGKKFQGGKFALATVLKLFQPFLDYMSINISSSAAVNKNLMDWKLEDLKFS